MHTNSRQMLRRRWLRQPVPRLYGASDSLHVTHYAANGAAATLDWRVRTHACTPTGAAASRS